MDDKKWEYEQSDGRWSVRGSYDEPDNIQYLLDGQVVRTMTVPGYRIWNYAAHLHDVIPELEQLVPHPDFSTTLG